jgi:hypothetical protein
VSVGGRGCLPLRDHCSEDEGTCVYRLEGDGLEDSPLFSSALAEQVPSVEHDAAADGE